MRRVISLWLPRFATDRLRRKLAREASAAGRPRGDDGLVAIAAAAGRALLTAVDDRAAAGGAVPGMALAEARALLPRLRVHPADPAGDGAALRRLEEWATRYTPWTAAEPGGEGLNAGGGAGLWLDVTGCAHLFGGEAALLSDLLLRLQRLGHGARAAIADTPGAAWAVARFAGGRPSLTLEKILDGRGSILPPLVARPALDRLPPAALRLPPAMAAELERLGLRTVGDLLRLPRANLARRFGGLPLRRLDQALGLIDEPISPAPPAVLFRALQPFVEPIMTAEAIAEALQRLLQDICRRLEKAQQGVRRLDLALYRVDGSLQRLAVGTSRPRRDAAALQRLFAQRLDRIDPGFGIEAMALTAAQTEPLTALQTVLAGRLRSTTPPSPRPLPPQAGLRVHIIPPLPSELRFPNVVPSPLVGEGQGEGAPEGVLAAADAADLRQPLTLTLSRKGRGNSSFAAPTPKQDRLDCVHALAQAGGVGISRICAPPTEAGSQSESPLPHKVGERVRVRGACEVSADLAPLVDTLANRLGFANLRRLAPRESHIPERAVTAVPALAAAPVVSWPARPPRPLRLFAPPQPIEAVALLPDDPPVMFRWRARLHRVRRAEGPERIEPEWWRPEDAARRWRDYFRVEAEDGRRFWLYREGAPPAGGRWYLHGLFA
jgi:protein ImuB